MQFWGPLLPVAIIQSTPGGISQSLAVTLDDIAVSASQTLGHSQSLAVTLDDVTIAISQTAGHSQDLSVTLGDVVFASNQTLGHPQSLALTLDDVVVDIAQTVAAGISQSLAVTLDDISVDVQQSVTTEVLIDPFWFKLWDKRKKKPLPEDIEEAVEFIHEEVAKAEAKPPKRPQVDYSEVIGNQTLQTLIAKQLVAARIRQLEDEEDEELLLLL